nr:hypothetical protein [Tanacetum cinerariifolium]
MKQTNINPNTPSTDVMTATTNPKSSSSNETNPNPSEINTVDKEQWDAWVVSHIWEEWPFPPDPPIALLPSHLPYVFCKLHDWLSGKGVIPRRRNSFEKTIADENGEIVGTCYPLEYTMKASKSDLKPPRGYWTAEEFVSINSTAILKRASPVVEGRVPLRTGTAQMQRYIRHSASSLSILQLPICFLPPLGTWVP